jgi:glutathione S-transferase
MSTKELLMQKTLYGLCGQDPERQFSPHVWKTIMSLKHKGLDFDLKPLPFTAIPEVEGGFSATVPVLRDGDVLVRDSFDIALYLDEAYPDRPGLFGGEGGKGMARFVEGFSQTVLHPSITKIVLMDIYNMLAPADRAYFRRTREARLGQTLEEVAENRFSEHRAFPPKLEPVRHALKSQAWIGGDHPLFADFIVFGALQWARIVSPVQLLEDGDPVKDWFERCLDLHDGAGRTVTAA